jgi:polygalacturonase
VFRLALSREALRRLSIVVAATAVAVGVAVDVPHASAGSGPAQAQPSGHRQVFNVRDFGAVGDGTTNDAPAVDRAIVAANAAGSGTVRFPAGTYLAGGTIHLLSNVTLDLDSGATLLGGPSGYDAPEPNPNDAYQDYGHSHFHDAMIWGDGLRNVGFVGAGVIDGGGNLITGDPTPGHADKIISLTRCDGLNIGDGLTLRRGGHFAILINDCNRVHSDHLTIDTATDRDGWDVISTRNVLITNATIAGNDDALAFKSDWALGATLPSGNVVVDNSRLSAGCCNALMFGSETCGDFTNYLFNDITITSAGKSGLGMVSMDGAHISNVVYRNITMSGTDSPLMEKIGTRGRCGTPPTVGSISNIHYYNVTGTRAGAFSPTLWGQPGHPITDLTFDNVDLTLPGGIPAGDPNAVPTDTADYNPRSLGVRPSYGFYLHNATGIRFTNSRLRLAADDGRPALIANTVTDLTLTNVSLQRGSTSPFDLGLQAVTGYCVHNVSVPGGGRARLSTPGGSTASCPSRLDNFALSAGPAAQTVTAGASTTYTVHTAATSGRPGPVTLHATGLRTGVSVSFRPATVVPGHDATMTVATTAAARNGSYPLTVVGTDVTATQYATVGLTVTGGVALSIANLSLADTANAGLWSTQSNVQAGAQVYGDRTVPFTTVPVQVQGAPWIRTANASRTYTGSPLVSFTINADATVAVAVDTRVGRRPWMDPSWVDTGVQLVELDGTTYRYLEVFEKPYAAGPVTLGPDGDTGGTGNMYSVLVL